MSGPADPVGDPAAPGDTRRPGVVRHHIRNRLLTGLIVIAPLGFTAWLLYFLFRLLDGILQPLLVRGVGHHVPGLGLLAVIALLYVVGLLATNVLGRQIVRAAEALILSTPGVRPIYQAAKQVMETLRLPGKGAFKRVVFLEYPRRDCWSIGFVTGEARREEDGAPLVLIFVPTVPNPTSGLLVILPAGEVRETPMSVEEGIRVILSGGILSPGSFGLPAGPPYS